MEQLFTVESDSIDISLHKDVYTKDVIFSTIYTFIDAAYIRLDQDDAGNFIIKLLPREGTSIDELRVIAGRFLNELLNECFRKKIHRRSKKALGYIVSRALLSVKYKPEEEDGPILGISDQGLPAGTMQDELSPARPDISQLGGGDQIDALSELDGLDDELDDPLEIMVPWEEKHGKEGDGEDGKN